MLQITRCYEIPENEWKGNRHHFPGRTAHIMGRLGTEPRKMLNGILWILRTGVPQAGFTRTLWSMADGKAFCEVAGFGPV